MSSIFPHLPRILLASAFAFAAFAAAPALSAPSAPKPDPIKGESTARDHKDMMTAQPVSCAAPDARPVNVASDPEEGGQVARKAKGSVKVADLHVMKMTDKASTKLMDAASGSSCPSGQH